MDNLSANQRSFIDLMKKSVEHARRGFELLVARPKVELLFDEIQNAGLFEPENNPMPIPARETGYFHIPYWPALNYLKAVAKLAGENNNSALAQKIMKIVRTVSNFRELDGRIRDNYHTFQLFSEILGLLPLSTISFEDLDLIPVWLESKFDGGMIGRALDQHVMRKLLESDSPDNWRKAAKILYHCTALKWDDAPELGDDCKKPRTVVDDYWLKEMIDHNACLLGSKIGEEAADIFLERIREVVRKSSRGHSIWFYRSAIEDHPQNGSGHRPEHRFVEGLRDVVLSWVDRDIVTARAFVKSLLLNDIVIIRRIGIYVLDQRWDVLCDMYRSILSPQLFDSDHLHELFGLLFRHFDKLTDEEKSATIDAIRKIPCPQQDNESGSLLKYIQRNWLAALDGKGYEPAQSWLEDLRSDQTLGPLPEHPDFDFYTESFRGSGRSPYQTQELILFAEEKTIVERLNAFQQLDDWEGPTTRALVDTLEGAITTAPQIFLHLLPEFLNANPPYQYGIINGFKSLWETPDYKQAQIDWEHAWNGLVTFIEQLIKNYNFSNREIVGGQNFAPNHNWIPSVIAELLRAGTQDDNKAYSVDLLPRALRIVVLLLERTDATDEISDDAMMRAINSSKGKIIEALYSHTLRACRVSDKVSGTHTEIWAGIKPAFDLELNSCKNANYDFSTLAGAYIVNLYYIDCKWLASNLEKIFPSQLQNNFACALEGLAYAPASEKVYSMLRESGILDVALRQESKGRNAREKVIERIALAYLWGIEELDAPRFKYFFEAGHMSDLESISDFLWNQKLSKDQIEKVLYFWDRCVAWSNNPDESPEKLMSKLSRLISYLDSVGNRELGLLIPVAPHICIDYNADNFIGELNRLSDTSPVEICKVLNEVLKTYTPSFDYQDNLVLLLKKISKRGMRIEAINIAEKLSHLPGILKFYSELLAEA